MWQWRLWYSLKPIGRAGVLVVAFGLNTMSEGGYRADDSLTVVGGIIAVAGIALAILNRRPRDERPR